MQVYPTKTSVYLAAAGGVTTILGLLVQKAVLVSWGGALLVGLAVARAVTQLSVARIRRSGFEMLWQGPDRIRRVARHQSIELLAEVRNRDPRAARYTALRCVCSPGLEVELSPDAGEVPALGRLQVTLTVTARRVGRHGIFGLSLEVQGNPGLFEVPLTFANPFGIEVLPHAYSLLAHSARGGRSRLSAESGRPGRFAGDGQELRELREHQAGDPFRRIAWKASARRGILLVREFEHEQRDVVWLVLDASVELWSGPVGRAPLDLAIDEAASVMERHLARGDSVGLAVVGARFLSQVAPDRGLSHSLKLLETLAHTTACYDADRSDLDEGDVAVRVLEHLRPLDPKFALGLVPSDIEGISERAARVRPRAPFAHASAWATSRRERNLRSYLAAFGMSAPARFEPDRPKTDTKLSGLLKQLMRTKPRPSVVYLWSPALDPKKRPALRQALVEFPQRRIELRWVSMRYGQSLSREGSAAAPALADATSVRCQVAQARGERALRNLGVRVERFTSQKKSA